MPFADPLARGKTKDKLELTELSAPLIDTVLGPGQVLYVPAGFPHTTDTKWTDSDRLPEDVRTREPSVHLTLGVDTHIWGLTYASIREFAYKRAGIEGSMLTKMKENHYWRYQSPLPVGFLADDSQLTSNTAEKSHELLRAEINAEFISILKESEPARWPSEMPNEQIVVNLGLNEVVDRLLSHHFQLVEIFQQMYADVAYQLTPTKMNLSIFRNQLYFKELEKAMEELHIWSAPKVSKEKKSRSQRQKK
jgi:Cupin superfamily protein